jgi:hypothetical protein
VYVYAVETERRWLIPRKNKANTLIPDKRRCRISYIEEFRTVLITNLRYLIQTKGEGM